MRTIQIPVGGDYKWMYIQPYGTICFSNRKPFIRTDKDGETHPNGKPIQWWDTEGEEKEVDFGLNGYSSWRKSLKRIA